MPKTRSGQNKREKREKGDVDVTGGVDAYHDGSLDSEYDGMSMKKAVQHLKQKYDGINIVSGSKYLSGEAGVDVVKASDALLHDFPILQKGGSSTVEIKMTKSPDGGFLAQAYTYAEMNGHGAKIEFNSAYLSAQDHSVARYADIASTERGGFHFPNNTTGAVAAHEIGHIIESRMLRLLNPTNGFANYRAHKGWNDGDVSGSIIHAAARKLGLTKGTSWTPDSIASIGKAHISGYAGENMHEAFAEAIGDVMANGRNAAPLSRAIYDEARRRAAKLV